ncbi:MW1434 family type I TA system toxin [Kosakonia sp. YIM B13611]|uniref:Thoeris anti-defense Tad2 family protein n=1 Tax=unclassified Kosakonia TaxID=2632876 RepID=UPI0036C7653F
MADLTAPEGSFAWAMLQLQAGNRVSRSVWHDAGMYLVRNPGLTEQVVVENDWRAAAGIAVGTAFNYLPNIELCNAQQDFVPWVATHEDMEAMDWSAVGGVGEPGDNWKVIFDMETIKINPAGTDGEDYGAKSYATLIQSPELLNAVWSFGTSYHPEYISPSCNFVAMFFTGSPENDEQLLAELSVAGIQIRIDDVIYDMSHDFKAYIFAHSMGDHVRFRFDDFNSSNDVYKMHQYLKSQVGRTIRVYVSW